MPQKDDGAVAGTVLWQGWVVKAPLHPGLPLPMKRLPRLAKPPKMPVLRAVPSRGVRRLRRAEAAGSSSSHSVEVTSSKKRATQGIKRPKGRAPNDKTGKPMVWNTIHGVWRPENE